MALTQAQLDSFWLPFTANRDFKQSPRLVTSAAGHYYQSSDGRQIYDAFSGLWSTGLGHCHPAIVEAVQRQVATLDYVISFQAGHEHAFALAEELTAIAPAGFSRCFFTNSGSESADTALKIALAYHHARGESQRARFIGRERAYHGVNFGGMSVGGIGANRKAFGGNLLALVDHLPHTHDLERNAFSRGLPQSGAERADALENLVALHGADRIAAVIIEPVAGSTGVLPPPAGYLQRLREICDRHAIVLIFDEVITAFGRLGHYFAAERFQVIPDIITTAKGLTNGVIPMGAVLVKDEIYQTLMQGPEQNIELFHGYTYSGHPVASAAARAALRVYREEGILEQARALEQPFEDALHSLAEHPLVADVRNCGLMGAIELAPRANAAGARGLEAHKKLFWEENIMLRNGMDTLAFSPFLNAKIEDIQSTVAAVKKVLDLLE